MKQLTLFTLLLFIFTSCEKDSDDKPTDVIEVPSTDQEVKIKVLFSTKENPNTFVFDIGTIIFVYDNLESTGYVAKPYLGDGMFLISKNDTVKPIRKYTIDKPEYSIFIPRDSIEIISIGINSAYYPDRFSYTVFWDATAPISYTLQNKP